MVESTTKDFIDCSDEKGDFTLYTGGYPLDITNDEVWELFKPFGVVRGFFPLKDNGKFKGVIFVKMETREMAQKAIDGLSYKPYKNGRYLKVNFAERSKSYDAYREKNMDRRPRDEYEKYDDYPPRRTEYDRRYDDSYSRSMYERDERRYYEKPRYPESERRYSDLPPPPMYEREERRYISSLLDTFSLDNIL